MSRPNEDRNQEATVYLVCLPGITSTVALVLTQILQGNLDERCTDALIWELMLQAGPVGTSLTSATSQLAQSTNRVLTYLICIPVHSERPFTQRQDLDGSSGLWVL